MALTDERWAVLGPLVEACRPPAKVPPSNLRRRGNGTKWRAIPAEPVWDLGARPAIPTRRDEAPVACPEPIHNNRNRVERLRARLKEWRGVAVRYETTARSFLGVLHLAATLDRIKR